ncbi:MAG: integrin alpha [Candidatus Gribaldobacteria bacterium]|nr:integrin alpha [Candidatus Gribaldobacteria bacterium]
MILSATTPEVDGYFGDTVAAGDVNGDGYADVVVGSYHGNGGGIDSGQVFVFYGTATGLDNTADLTINGEVADDHFGSALSLAGDVNGDGYTDIIVGAPYKNSNAGKAYIYYGGASMNNTVDVVFSGAAAKDYLGESVAAAGDVNGDGFDDVIVGSPRNNQWSISNPECRAGQAHIYYGGASMDNTADISFTDYLGIDSDYLCLDYFGRSGYNGWS